ncbi:MAG: 3'(2'),5'-bisphosphate nucleotidase CysQ [Pseudomonadota bacterium]
MSDLKRQSNRGDGASDRARDEELRRIATTMRQLAIAAGAETLRFFGDKALAVTQKSDDSPVTVADHAADAVIVDGLRAAFPDIPLVTEERADGHAALLGVGARRFFLIDPLDGTKEFLGGSGEYTVNIALIEDGVPVLGAVFAPAMDRLFWTPEPDFAVEEREEVRGDRIEPDRRLWVATADNSALRAVASRSHRDPDTDAFLARLKVARIVGAGSSLKICLVAAGEADLYPRMGPTMAWDTAAAHAVLRAAGVRLRRLSDQGAVEEALRYGLGQTSGRPFANPFFLAAAPSVVIPPRYDAAAD